MSFKLLHISFILGLATANSAFAVESLTVSPDSNEYPVMTIKKAAESGDPGAQYMLGMLYVTGDGLPVNQQSARNWFRRAAEQGHPKAQNCLGILFDPAWSGIDNDTSPDEAATWYRRAAAQGDEAAIQNLKAIIATGKVKDTTMPTMIMVASKKSSETVVATPELVAKKDPKTIFKSVAPAIVEIIGDGNYGSGVIIGKSQWTKENNQNVQLSAKDYPTQFAFQKPDKKIKTAFKLSAKSLKESQMVIATNIHVLEGSKNIKLGIGSNEEGKSLRSISVNGYCLANKKNLDLALVFASYDANQNSVNIVDVQNPEDKIEKGSTVYAVGNPERLVRFISQGLYNGKREEGLQFNASISHGSSGGALVNEDGQLIGIILGFSGAADSQNLNFAIPITEIHELLEKQNVTCYGPTES